MNKTEQLIDLLKGDWYSNFQMQRVISCSAADRICRKIRSNPPKGFIIIDKKVKASYEFPAHKKYKLVAND